MPEIFHSWSWISLAVREYVVHNQEWESEILTHQNNLQFLYIPLIPDHTKYVEKWKWIAHLLVFIFNVFY